MTKRRQIRRSAGTSTRGKRTPKRRKKRVSLVKKADRLFSVAIRDRDGRCLACGARDNLQCAHIISRRYTNDGLRWDFQNAVTLCHRDHVFYTYRPLEWESWVDERFPGRLTRLKRRALGPIKKPDLEGIVRGLGGDDE